MYSYAGRFHAAGSKQLPDTVMNKFKVAHLRFEEIRIGKVSHKVTHLTRPALKIPSHFGKSLEQLFPKAGPSGMGTLKFGKGPVPRAGETACLPFYAASQDIGSVGTVGVAFPEIEGREHRLKVTGLRPFTSHFGARVVLANLLCDKHEHLPPDHFLCRTMVNHCRHISLGPGLCPI